MGARVTNKELPHMDATVTEEDDSWRFSTVERSEEEKRSLYDVDLAESKVAWSRFLPLVEFEDGALRFTRRLR